MTDYTDLIVRLRDVQRLRNEGKPIPVEFVFDQCAVAADAIESLVADKKWVCKLNDELVEASKDLGLENATLKARLLDKQGRP